MSLYNGYFAEGFNVDPSGESVFIKMDCVLIEETWCKCVYQCVELGEKNEREDRAGGGIQSEDIPYPFVKIKTYRQMSACPKTKNVAMQLDEWKGLGDCSKNDCKTACNATFTTASQMCKLIPNPVAQKACKVVAAAAKVACKELCNDCTKP